MPHPLSEYYVVECTGDSLINGLNFRKVGDHLMHQNGGKIYFWYGDSLNLVYDFEVEVGDTVHLNLLSCEGGVMTWLFRVDSVGTIAVSGQTLKRIVTRSLPDDPYWFYPDGYYTYIEKIGRPDGVIIEDLPPCVWVLGVQPPWLRCYSDATIDYKSDRFLSLGDYDCTFRPSSSTGEAPAVEWSVSPNPATEFIHIQTEEAIVEVRLFGATGQHLLSSRLQTEKRLDVRAFPAGLYWLQMLGKQGESLGMKKVMLMN